MFPWPSFQEKERKNENCKVKYLFSTSYLSEYAYVLKPKGRIYCITDVEYLHEWHEDHLSRHSQFKKISDEELKKDVKWFNLGLYWAHF